MNTPECPHRSRTLPLLLMAAMIVYGGIFLTMVFCRFTTTQIFFVTQMLNALGFFIGLAAFIKTARRS
jgi:positive regulator of sigma E activity